MTEKEAIAIIEKWDVCEAAKVLTWYEDRELLRPVDCETEVALKTEELNAEVAKLMQLVGALDDCRSAECGDCVRWDHEKGECSLDQVLRDLGFEVEE